MFAFVFVVMVPLYNVLCDAYWVLMVRLPGQAYTSVPVMIDESREGHGAVCRHQEQ